MMRLPGRLRSTTLGDLLGSLHRAKSTGTLELTDEHAGRTHRIHLRLGAVSAVEVDGPAPHLAEILRARGAIDEPTVRRSILRSISSRKLIGKVLVEELHIDPAIVGDAVRHQLRIRLELLEKLHDARITFRVATKQPPEALHDPLEAKEFLRGRKRARDRNAPMVGGDDLRACTLLGVPAHADAQTIKRAYRRLARALHPDTHPNATAEERRDLSARFAEVTAAYLRLSA
jgi:hypothetical protein